MRSSKSMRLVRFAAVMLLSTWAGACSRSAMTISADKTYDGRTINLRVGDGVKLALDENPTTGYRWEFVRKPEPICVIVADAYVANTDGGKVGAGGVHTWDFRAVDKGTATVGLAYRRPWEKDAAPAQTFTLTLEVK
jgi:inhibitor of cysteine peptidase